MKLRSSIAAKYAGVAMVMCLMPVVPVVADAQTTYEQQQSTERSRQSIQVSYKEKVSDIVATGYETVYETNLTSVADFSGEAVVLTDSYIDVKDAAQEEAEVIGRLYDYTLVYVEEMGSEWTKITSGNVTGYVKNSSLCFGDEAQCIINESEELEYELVQGYTLEEAEEKEAREEAERIAAEEAARKAAEEEAKRAAALAGVGVSYNPTMQVSDDELWLLACIIDWEAGNESYEGKLAVANVVLNRVRSGKWGSSITSVIYAPRQFSGVTDGNGNTSAAFAAKMEKGPRQSCIEAAMEALSGVNNVGGYTSFRALYVANYSAYNSYIIIGNHCFF